MMACIERFIVMNQDRHCTHSQSVFTYKRASRLAPTHTRWGSGVDAKRWACRSPPGPPCSTAHLHTSAARTPAAHELVSTSQGQSCSRAHRSTLPVLPALIPRTLHAAYTCRGSCWTSYLTTGPAHRSSPRTSQSPPPRDPPPPPASRAHSAAPAAAPAPCRRAGPTTPPPSESQHKQEQRMVSIRSPVKSLTGGRFPHTHNILCLRPLWFRERTTAVTAQVELTRGRRVRPGGRMRRVCRATGAP